MINFPWNEMVRIQPIDVVAITPDNFITGDITNPANNAAFLLRLEYRNINSPPEDANLEFVITDGNRFCRCSWSIQGWGYNPERIKNKHKNIGIYYGLETVFYRMRRLYQIIEPPHDRKSEIMDLIRDKLPN